ncbi:unnamed protein product [Brassica oleracea]
MPSAVCSCMIFLKIESLKQVQKAAVTTKLSCITARRP